MGSVPPDRPADCGLRGVERTRRRILENEADVLAVLGDRRRIRGAERSTGGLVVGREGPQGVGKRTGRRRAGRRRG